MASISDYPSDAKGRPRGAAEIVTNAGTRIYLLPVETFPGHLNNLYLIDHPDHALLVDVGTGRQEAQAELEARFEEVRERFGVQNGPEDLAEVVISHAHIDHFGNAHYFRDRKVPIAIHELDARVLEGFKERFLLASRDLALYLYQTGMKRKSVDPLMELYRERASRRSSDRSRSLLSWGSRTTSAPSRSS